MSAVLRTTYLKTAVATLLLGGSATPSLAHGCRAQQIMASQCTWFCLEEIGGSKRAAAQAQREATSTLIDGCSQGEYQMVLLRGTGLSDGVVARLRTSRKPDPAMVRAECAAAAQQVAAR